MTSAKKLECSICLELFKKPKILPCFHTFCQKCLEGLAASSQQAGTFLCPTCRTTIFLPPGGVASFQNNFYITDDLEEERKARKTEKCSLHKDQQLTLVCKQCDVHICNLCKVSKHRIHRTVPVAEQLAMAKKKLTNIANDLDERAKTINSALGKVADSEGDTKKRVDNMKADIVKKTRVWLTKLSKVRNTALEKVNNDFHTGMEKLEEVVIRAQKELQKTTSLLEQTRRAANQERGSCVLSSLTKIQAEVSSQENAAAILAGELTDWCDRPPVAELNDEVVTEMEEVMEYVSEEGLLDLGKRNHDPHDQDGTGSNLSMWTTTDSDGSF